MALKFNHDHEPLKVKHDGESGRFIPESDWKEIETLNEKNEALELEIEKARGEQKYKLKKLSQIIERKDKQLESLRRKQEG